MVVIDVHNHLDNDSKRQTFQTADILVKRLDKYGFNMSVIMPNPVDTLIRLEEPNNLIHEAMKKYPERFIGFCCVNPLFKDKAVKEIERCLSLGFKGIGEIVPDCYQISADDNALVSLIQNVKDFDGPILFHVGDTPYCRPKVMERFISKFPEKVIIMGHMGAWEHLLDDVLSIVKRYGKAYLDTACIETSNMVKRALYEVGVEKIIFGSDSFRDEEVEKELNKIEVHSLAAREKDLIMGGNLARLLKLRL